jgi:hypothetical protein
LPLLEIAMIRSMLVAAVLLLAAHGSMGAEEKFTVAAIRIEQNAIDKDVEIVFEAKGGKIGLASLKVVAPDGRTVIDFKAPDSKMGIRHVNLESPEPANDGSLQADFPEGRYRFTGTTVTGVSLHSDATLSHKLPPTASFVRPGPDHVEVPATKAVITWRSARDLAAHIIVIEQESTGVKMTTTLPGSATTYTIPDGLLAPGAKCKLEIGTVSRAGNISFVETSFTTAGRRSG